jgi:phosphoglycolate phosphatase
LLFDLDGTLADSAITIAAALSALAIERGGQPIPVGRVRRLVSKGASVLVREALGSLAGDVEADVARFREVLAGIPADASMIFPGVVAALETVSGMGHPCAVVTNKPAKLAARLLDQLNLAHFFTCLVGGDSVASCKPDPLPLLHAMQCLGANGGAAIMIGDSPVDAAAAAAAGVPFVLYRRGYEADLCASAMVAAAFDGFDRLPAAIMRVVSAGQVTIG